ncbi:MAG: hypothetical protein R3C44_10285 [Chloroflexota bacterium]
MFDIRGYNPDVLSLRQLEQRRGFHPATVGQPDRWMLLPDALWSDPETTFLDPATKSSAFLREIAKRLMKGLEDQIPPTGGNCIDHIFSKQLFEAGDHQADSTALAPIGLLFQNGR